MSNRLFAANCPVIHCAAKRVPRTWGRTLCDVLVLLVLAALCGWLWSCVKSAAHGSLFTVRGSPLALAPLQEGMVMGVLLSLLAMAVVLAVRKMAENERFCAALHEQQLAAKRERLRLRREFQEDALWPHDKPVVAGEDPLAAPGRGVDAAERREIYGALIVAACEAREMVRKAAQDCSAEDYGDRLAGAERRLGEAIHCLAGLLDQATRENAALAARGAEMRNEEPATVILSTKGGRAA